MVNTHTYWGDPQDNVVPRPVAAPSGQAQAKERPGIALLALDGEHLAQTMLPSALQICQQGYRRIDILLTSPPKEPLQLLARFLQSLERAGMDYRLISAEGDLASETLRHVQRNRQIAMILVGSGPNQIKPMEPAFRQLREMGLPIGVLLA